MKEPLFNYPVPVVITAVFLSILIFFSDYNSKSSHSSSEGIDVNNLLCEHQNNPLGVEIIN